MTTAYKKAITGKVQGDGVQTYTLPEGRFDKPNQITFINHQLTVEPVLATTGTVAISIQVWGATEFRPLLDPFTQSQVILSLADTDTVSFTGHVTAFKFTPAGADGTFNLICSGW